MPNSIRIASPDELPEQGKMKEFALGEDTEETVCVTNMNGEFYAVDGSCLHAGAPLAFGVLRNGYIVCPWHGWEFDCKTGCASHNPNIGVRKYEVRIQGNDVLVEPE